jgi:hypothetical protein
MRTTLCLSVAAVIGAAFPGYGQTGDPLDLLQRQLIAQFPLTTATADRSDIAKAGAVLVLQKSGLMMYSTASPRPPLNTYKHGKISQSVGRDFAIGMSSAPGTTANDYPHRKFVNGEKFWITDLAVHKDAIVLQLFSDPYGDVRYYADLKFPLDKGAIPTLDQARAMIAEVIAVDSGSASQAPEASAPSGQNGNAGTAVAATPVSTPAPPREPAPPPIPAPPPPPKSIAKGDTKQQVEAAFGQPERMVTVGAKEIYFYKDLKVTFLNGKVTDVE